MFNTSVYDVIHMKVYIGYGIFCRPKDPNSENGQTAQKTKAVSMKRAHEDTDGQNVSLSKNKQKKKVRNPRKNFCPELKRKEIL